MFEQLAQPRIYRCTLGAWLIDLDEESRANIEAALHSDLSANAIRKAIIDEAKKAFSDKTIIAHRGSNCRCTDV